MNKEAMVSIENCILKQNITQAHEQFKRLLGESDSVEYAVKNVMDIGCLSIAIGISAEHIHLMISSGSQVLLDKYGADFLFSYWILLYKKDPELYTYAVDIDVSQLAGLVEHIDTEAKFKENHSWFLKYNKKLLRDLFPKTTYSSIPTICNIDAACQTANFIYYKTSNQWHRIDLRTTQQIPQDVVTYPVLYSILGNQQLADIINNHRHQVLNSVVMKIDRYIIVPGNAILTLMQLMSFSLLDSGNFRLHFLLDTCWKKRASQYTKVGYANVQKVIAGKNDMKNIQAFESMLVKYYINIKIPERLAYLNSVYPHGYLSNLRQEFKDNTSGMRILIFASRHSTFTQHACETLKKGFNKIGCKAMVLKERPYQGKGLGVEFMCKVIQNFRPNLIMAVNNFRLRWIVENLPNIPFATWIQDHPHTLSKPSGEITSNDFVFASTKSLIEKEIPEELPFLDDHHVAFLPIIRDIKQSYSVIKKKKYDIGCITHLNILPEVLSYYEPEKRTGDRIEKLIHSLLEAMVSLEPFEIASILVSKEKSLDLVKRCSKNLQLRLNFEIGPYHPFILQTFQYGVGHFLQKTLSLRHLINQGFDSIFIGGLGWDQLSFFRPYAKGPVSHEDLHEKTAEIAISLNPNAISTFHPRIGEILEADSFVMSSWKGDVDTSPLIDFFIEDEEVVFYRTYEDLSQKVNYYLQHPEKREAITKRAMTKFIKNFSAEIGCQKVLNTVLDRQIK